MQECTHAAREVETTRSPVAMDTTSRTLRRTHSGVLNVSIKLPREITVCIIILDTTYIDVKMDWCNTKVNGTELDPKVQYAQMVSILPHYINNYSKCFFFF